MSSTTASTQGYLLVIAANAEAARAGHALVDVDHLLLGLLVTGGAATTLLTAAGVDLAAARGAVRELQRRDLETLGVGAQVPTGLAREHYGHGVQDLPLLEPAWRALKRQSSRHTDAVVLEALLADPRGAARRVVEHLGADADALRNRAARAAVERRDDRRHVDEQDGPGWGVAVEHVVAVPRTAIWQLVSDPQRLPVWHGSVSAVEVTGERTWTTRFVEGAVRKDPDERWTHTVVDQDEGRAIEWEVRDARGRLMNRLRIEVVDAERGARLTMRHQVAGPGRLHRIPVPVSRWMLRAHLHWWLLAVAQTASR